MWLWFFFLICRLSPFLSHSGSPLPTPFDRRSNKRSRRLLLSLKCCSLWLVVAMCPKHKPNNKNQWKREHNHSFSEPELPISTDTKWEKKNHKTVRKGSHENASSWTKSKSKCKNSTSMHVCECCWHGRKVHNKNSWYFFKRYYYRHYPRRV